MTWTVLNTFVDTCPCCDNHKFRAGRVKTECDGTRAETRFVLPAKRTSPFISAGVSVQSAAGSRGVRISSSRVETKSGGTRRRMGGEVKG